MLNSLRRRMRPSSSGFFEPLESRLFLHAGTIDTAFGSGGVSTQSNSTKNAQLTDVAVLSDGRYVSTGTSVSTSNGTQLSVTRFQSNGSPDSSFGVNGAAQSFIGNAQVFGVAIQSDAKTVVVGGKGTNAFVLRYLTNGKHDKTFGDGGLVQFTFQTNVSVARDVQILGNGQIIVGGEATAANLTNSVAFTRLNANGSIDQSFGVNGFAVTKFSFSSFGSDTFSVDRIIVDPSGRLLFAGRYFDGAISPSNGDDALAIGRLTSNGVPDPTFGTGGLALRDLGTLGESNTGIAVDSQSRPYTSVGGAGVLGAIRWLANGRRDNSFGSGGLARVTGNGNTGDVVLDSDGNVIVGGELGVNDNLARFTSAGALDPEFGASGLSAAIPFTSPASVDRVVLSPDATILAAGTGGSSTARQLSVAKFFSSDVPIGQLNAKPLTTQQTSSYVWTVTWIDADGIDVSTLNNNDLTVSGPGGFITTARFVSADTSAGLARVPTKYKIAPPNGIWNAATNGTYTISVRANQVANLDGNFAEAGVLGTFVVSIA